MPINMSVEYPKLENENSSLKMRNKILIDALKEVVKSHRMYDAIEYAKEGLSKAKKVKS